MNTQIIVDRISDLCKEKSVSINQMLKETNLNKSLVDNLKKGSMPSIDKMECVADYFGVSVDYLLGKTDKKEKPAGEGELSENIIIYHRDGKTVKRTFTKEQLALFHAMLDAIPEDPNDNKGL